MIKAVCFDLDGTLLPMDVDTFCAHYFGMLARHMAPHGYEPKALINAIMIGTKAMYKNDGSRTNEVAFWDAFCTVFGENARDDEAKFAEFYEAEFDKARAACGFDPTAAPALRACRELGLRVCIGRVLTPTRSNFSPLTRTPPFASRARAISATSRKS